MTKAPYSSGVNRTRPQQDLPAWLADLGLALATLVPTILLLGIYNGMGEYPRGVALLYAVGCVAPLMLRRRWPWVCLALTAAVSMTVTEMTMFTPATLVAVWSIADLRGREQGVGAGIVALASFVVHRLVWGGDLAVQEWATIVTLTALAVAVGLYARARRSYLGGLEERGTLLAEQAVAEERLRIARELHDAVGHKVSLMVISAQALEAQSTGTAKEAGRSIAHLGREAMNEMRATVSRCGRSARTRSANRGRRWASWRGWSTRRGAPGSAPSCGSRASPSATRWRWSCPPTGSCRRR